MSDIDIEEHDLLEDPTLRRIFPDLSVIKKEISQYEEGLSTAPEGAPLVLATIVDTVLVEEPAVQKSTNVSSGVLTEAKSQESTPQTPANDRLEIHRRFKTFLDSLADDSSDNTDITEAVSGTSNPYLNENFGSSPSYLSNIIESPHSDIKHITNNIFIIGSKPNVTPPKTRRDKKEIKIVLRNISPYLEGSKHYCKHCLILFPNIDAFQYHFSKLHSPKSNINKQVGLKSSEIKFQCDICTIKLSSKYSLLRHLKMVHKNRNIGKSGKKRGKRPEHRILNNDTKAEEKGNSTKSHDCIHCSEVFETRSSLIEHLYDVLNPKQSVSKNSVKSEQNRASSNSISNKNMNAENTNLSTNIECYICTIKFTTQKLLDQHNRVTHINNETVLSNKNSLSESNHFQNSHKVKQLDSVSCNESKINETFQQNKIIPAIKQNKVSITYQKSHSDSESDAEIGADNSSSCNYLSDFEQTTNNDKAADCSNVPRQLYQCFVCSQYIVFFKRYSIHMLQIHNIEVSDGDKTVFESQCKLCPLKLPKIKSYNYHIKDFHKDISRKKVKLRKDKKVFNSVLYKCDKCDVFFLSANVAKNHSEHEELPANWKCSCCQRVFKLKDKWLHLKQHSLSNTITAYDLCNTALSRVLYKCLNCAVHFSEDEYFLHCTRCDLEVANSTYCKTCDILINSDDMPYHELSHVENKLQSRDFTLVESEIIVMDDDKDALVKSKFALTYCRICNCYLGEMASRHRVHVKGRCSKTLNPRVCYKCGLVFTPKGLVTHETQHRRVSNLNLQSFTFYDIKTKTLMRPPIPLYPSCKICEVHFLNKTAIKEHECEKQKYIKCNYCEIKLTEAAYKLHVHFHKYNASLVTNKSQKSKLKTEKIVKKSIKENNSHPPKTVSSESKMLNVLENTNKSETNIIYYNCVSCNTTVNTFDEVIMHCHDHYDSSKEIRLKEPKNIPPSNDKLPLLLNFEPFYFRFDKDVWIKHISGNLYTNQIKLLLDNSIYKNECRLKMDLIQSATSSLTLYKCGICRVYVHPNELYSHASNRQCNAAKKHPCSQCGLCFNSSNYQHWHERKFHKRTTFNVPSYKIILFNKKEDEQFTEAMLYFRDKFILYQCRVCEGILDKFHRENHLCCNVELMKCPDCGLLFYQSDFMLHRSKHTLIKTFKPENIIVVLFGKLEIKKDNKFQPAFKGTIYDLTFYKCKDCGMCLKTKNHKYKHLCSKGSKCSKCHLSFSEKDLYDHLRLHENILELGRDTLVLNVIILDSFIRPTGPTINSKSNKGHENNDKQNKKEIEENESKNSDIIEEIYKCKCGLHFLEEINARNHLNSCNPRMKMSKQNCFKCHLLFTPGELFNHLLKHHGDKKIKYKFEIINVSEK